MTRFTGFIGLLFAVALVTPVAAVAQPELPKGKRFQGIRDQFEVVDSRLDHIEGTVQGMSDVLKNLLDCVSIFEGELGGLPGPHVVFSRCNVHVRSGNLATDAEVNGLGNLILGYNEGRCFTLDAPPGDGPAPNSDPAFPAPCLTDDECGGGVCLFGERGGSHNLVVGHQHEYRSFGGIVGGRHNVLAGAQSSVTGGFFNGAREAYSAVHGGAANHALGRAATVVGGTGNDATGERSAVLGGSFNTAQGTASAIVSGSHNAATGRNSAVVGGGDSDGSGNEATGDYSAILGGRSNSTGLEPGEGAAAAICGGFGSNASGRLSAVSGGELNAAVGVASVVAGGAGNTAGGRASAVSGGLSRSVGGESDWRAGGLSQDE